MDLVKIQSLIAQNKILDPTTISLSDVYVQVGVYQYPNGRRSSGDFNTYAPYVISLQDVIVPSSSGLFAQLDKSVTIQGTTTETSLISSFNIGSLTVPANTFVVGDSYKLDMFGHFRSRTNSQLTIRVKVNGNTLDAIGPITMPGVGPTEKHWNMECNFTVRKIGTLGAVMSGAIFTFSVNSPANTFAGSTFVEDAAIDTTIINTLDVTAQWSDTNANNVIYSNTVNLYKTY